MAADEASARRAARLLAAVREDIDRFLDPSVLALLPQEAAAIEGQGAALGAATAAASAPSASELAGQQAAAAASEHEQRQQLLELRDEGERLRAALALAREEAEAQRRRAEAQGGREAAAVARLERRCEALDLEGRAARQRAAAAEGRLAQAEAEREALRQGQEAAAGQATAREAAAAEAAAEERRRLEAELAALQAELAAARAAATAARPEADASAEEAEALRLRVAELEAESRSLQLIQQEAGPDRELAARLRERHGEYERELAVAREAQRELRQVKEQLLRLELEREGLLAAAEARAAALQQAEEAGRRAELARRELDAFVAAAAPMAQKEGAAATALDLSLAWARCQAQLGHAKREHEELKGELDREAQRRCQSQADVSRLRNELASAQSRIEELQLDLRRARDDGAAHKARVEVLRQAIKAFGAEQEASGEAGAAAAAAEAQRQLEAAERRARDFEALAESRKKAADEARVELAKAGDQADRVAEAEAKLARLERVNADLWAANRELEQYQQRLAAELDERDRFGGLDYDQTSTKILHLARGLGGVPATGSSAGSAEQQLERLRAENAHLREELLHRSVATPPPKGSEALAALAAPAAAAAALPAASPGDLQSLQAERQLDRFKKATKKYVQDFREGIFGLLGWKVDMKGEGNDMRWHLTSRYQGHRELVFQLRPGAPGRRADFDLLETEWAEELAQDRQAMAYLEIYGSVPGFLASITSELLMAQTPK